MSISGPHGENGRSDGGRFLLYGGDIRSHLVTRADASCDSYGTRPLTNRRDTCLLWWEETGGAWSQSMERGREVLESA